MQLSKETIEELKKILKKDYGQNLSTQEATEVANNLVGYFDLMAKIHHQNKIKEKHKTQRSNNNTMHFLTFEKVLY